MKLNKCIRINNELVPVTEEVYIIYHKMARRERYLEEKDAEKGKTLYSNLDTTDMLGEEMIPDLSAASIEETILAKCMVEKLYDCMSFLDKSELKLIKLLFFVGYSERELSKITGIPRKTISYQKRRILEKLKNLLI